MTPDERAAIRAEAFREAAEIARTHGVIPTDDIDDWRIGYACGRKEAARDIEARAKEKRP